MPWLQEVKAAHERLEKLRLIQLLEMTHAANPAALHAKLLAELMPTPTEKPFARLMARAKAQQARHAAAT